MNLAPASGHLSAGEVTKIKLTGRCNLSNRRLTALPTEIGQLTSLQYLMLEGNQLTALPPEIGQLTSLGHMRLATNRLTALPPEIGQLTSLQELPLDGNRLTALPLEIAGLLMRGLFFRLDGNPLRDPIPELLGQGATALAAYLDSLGDAIPLFEAKGLLVGEGNVGKTSL